MDGPVGSLGFVLTILVDLLQLTCHNWEGEKNGRKKETQNNKTQYKTFSLQRGSLILCPYSAVAQRAIAQSNLFSYMLMRHNFLHFTECYQQALISQPN